MGQSLAEIVPYRDITAVKRGAIPDDVMEKIMGLDIAKVKGQSVAAAGIFEWLLSAVDPPSPQKAGMLVHTLTKLGLSIGPSAQVARLYNLRKRLLLVRG